VKKLKKMLILVPLAIMTLLAMIAPAMACQVNGEGNWYSHIQCFTGTQIGSSAPGPNYVATITSNDILIVKDLLGHGFISLWISPNSYPSAPSLQGTSSSVIDVKINLNTGIGWITYQMTWTFTGGSFQGIIVGKLVGPPGIQPSTAYADTDCHGILVGSGVFKGQTAIFDGSKPVGQPFSWTGIIVMA
jgi:hypothetical protein